MLKDYMNMTTTEQIQKKLQTANLYQISKQTGITWQTLYNIRNKKVEPYASTLTKLVTYFEEFENEEVNSRN